MEKFDVIVIGAGPAGLAAARNLKESGKSVAIVENDLWGGTCPNRGCDPKKVLLSAVQARDKVIQLQEKGFSEVPNIDWTKLEAFKKTFTDPVSKGSKKTMIDADIKAIDGAAQFIDDNKISVSGVSYSADNFIIATGQRPSILDIPGKEYLQTSNEFLSLPQMPKTITFIGGGYIAFELATIANAAGAKVNIVLHNDHPLKEFDKSFALDLVDQLKSKGVNFYFNVNTKEIKKTADEYELVADNLHLKSNLIIAATGRIPNVETLNLEKAHIEYNKHGIIVDDNLHTTNYNIFAVGDVLDKKQPKLTPVAGFEANYVVGVLNGNEDSIDYPVIPTIVYGSPQLAQLGVTVTQAKNSSEYTVVEQDLTNWFTYRRTNEPIAKAKMIFDKDNRLVGANLLSGEADNLINLLTMAINKKMTHSDITKMILGYPTVASDLEYLM